MASFPSIRIEGGLLGPEILDQLITADLPGQKPADFGLGSRRGLTDEIAAVFAEARMHWGAFQLRLQRLPENDLATTATRDAWVIPFLGLLGYEPRYNPRAQEVDGLSFAISHRAMDTEDSPPVHIVGARQELGRVPASGRPRLAPHSLVQEYLNRTEHLWGLVTNGFTLRLLRDCTFVRRQAYIEFDLQAMIEEQRFQDFVALYRLLHRTRLPRGMDDADDCLLEKYYSRSVEQGGRVREHLRDGVEECIRLLGNGFLLHPKNDELRRRVSPGYTGNDQITPDNLFRQILRLVYRFLFLLVSEERGLLSNDLLYREHYGIVRLRRMLDHHAFSSEHDDLWQSLRVLWKVFGNDQLAEVLHLAPLNGELFAPQALDSFTITNRDLLEAFRNLSSYRESPASPPRRVNYSALDVEELGSVYESLLDFHPAVTADAAGRPGFDLIEGSERKTTGSYYTPPQLVNELILSALEPVIRDRLAARPREQEKALLSIRVCDPACGSGHFLLAAARRLGKELARVRTGEDEPAPERMREAIRDVISHCIYGVDRNPLAVDLCRVALWLEGHTGGKPLTFLDHRIRCGDSLVGVFDLETLADGIPDKAFEPLEGDDRAIARAYGGRNRKERLSGQTDMFSRATGDTLIDFSLHSLDVDSIADDSPEAIRRKKRIFEESHTDPAWRRQQETCDLWTAAFFQPLVAGAPVITSNALADHRSGHPIEPRLLARAESLSVRQRFFHWPLEFPEVFADGGFDVILSNPPWERLKLQEQEFFAARDYAIAQAPTKAARAELIRELPRTNPELHREFVEALRAAAGASGIIRNGGRFPLAGRGDINTYAIFAELCREVIHPGGRCGIIVPSGIATDDTTKFFFQDLIQSNSLVSLFDFENRKGIFPAVHKSYKFCLLTCTRSERQEVRSADFVFFALDTDDLRQPEKRFSLTAEEIALLNPNTGNCPTFRTQADAELTKAIYRRVPVLWREAADGNPEINPWQLSFNRMFDMSNDSHQFRTASELGKDGFHREGNIFVSIHNRYLPLYEGKMVQAYDHRAASVITTENIKRPGQPVNTSSTEYQDPEFSSKPQYWIKECEVERVIPKNYKNHWFIGFKSVTSSTNERTFIATVLPWSGVANSMPLILTEEPVTNTCCLLGNLNSFIFDYVAKQKVGGVNLNFFIIEQFPVIPPSSYTNSELKFIISRVLELVFTAWDIKPYAEHLNCTMEPFAWDDSRRFEIRCELDAAFFHLYLPCEATGEWRRAESETSEQLATLKRHFPAPRDAVDHILDQFPIVRRNDEAAHGRYRTKERILEIYDELLVAQREGRPYQSGLNPPPGTRI